ncbi:MAG: adenylate/guanylate cyclase domain-containing protein [Actinomycetota bacterium]|nr:adenylate/guanylate cyclase domain-containing protein [Actinomycetota bacterium]
MRVQRCFGFVDLCGFTAFTERFGDELAVVALARFRTTLREIAARRGVRITKWLGDGAMLSSADTEATVAMVLEVSANADAMLAPALRRADATQGNGNNNNNNSSSSSSNPELWAADPWEADAWTGGSRPVNEPPAGDDHLALRAGLASGPVIMFEGDDYIGRPTNMASRLCDAAMPGQVLATREVAAAAPRWAAASEALTYYVRGFDKPLEAVRLKPGTSDTMVTDPVCKLSLPLVSGLVTRRMSNLVKDDGAMEYFCSTACALAWEQAQRGATGAPFPI